MSLYFDQPVVNLLEMDQIGQIVMMKEEFERRKAKAIKLKKQVLTIVENLIEPENLNESNLIDNCKYLSKNDYYDVTVERSIIDHCGYPLCTNSLAELSKKKQQYKICLKTHQVFDITDRKMFCSNLCFTKSNYLKDQLSDEVLWLRDLDDDNNPVKQTEIKLYKKSRASFGDEVKLDINLTKDLIHELHKEGDSLKYKLYCNDCCRDMNDTKITTNDNKDDKKFDKCSNENCKNKTTGVKLDKSINFPYIQEDDLNMLKDKLKNMKIKERKLNLTKPKSINSDSFEATSTKLDSMIESKRIRPVQDQVFERFDKISLKNFE